MEIEIKFFARYREALGVETEQVVFDKSPSLDELCSCLAERGEIWRKILQLDSRLLVAVNQERVQGNPVLAHGDEVAFFPPVTGG